MSRAAFWACVFALLLLGRAYQYQLLPHIDPRLGWIVYALLLFVLACVLSKRLHDRGRAGWWAFAPVWAVVQQWPRPSESLLSVVALLVLAVSGLDLMFMPGKPGVNRFGANPAEARRTPPPEL